MRSYKWIYPCEVKSFVAHCQLLREHRKGKCACAQAPNVFLNFQQKLARGTKMTSHWIAAEAWLLRQRDSVFAPKHDSRSPRPMNHQFEIQPVRMRRATPTPRRNALGRKRISVYPPPS